MENETIGGTGLSGASNLTPKASSPLENELQGLKNETKQLSNIIDTLCSRLSLVTRQPNENKIAEKSEKDQVELSPIPQSIRVQKENILRNVFIIRDLLDRLEL